MIKHWSLLFFISDVGYTVLYVCSFLIGKINIWILVSYIMVAAAFWMPLWDYLMKEIGEQFYETKIEWNHNHENTLPYTVGFKLVSFFILIIGLGFKMPIEHILDNTGITIILSVMLFLLLISLLSSRMIYVYHFLNVEKLASPDVEILKGKYELEMVPSSTSALDADDVTNHFVGMLNKQKK